MSFIKEDGKGFVGAHTGDDAFFEWPEFLEMIGGYFDNHPWSSFDAPIVIEDPAFPAMKHFPVRFTIKDEIYQHKDFSRAKIRVLASLDSSKLDYTKPNIHRDGQGFPRRLGQNVRQRPRLLFHLRPRPGNLGRPADTEDVLRSHALGAPPDG